MARVQTDRRSAQGERIQGGGLGSGGVNRPLEQDDRECARVFDISRFTHDIAAAYDRHIEAAGKEAQFIILVAFLLTFGIVRFITHAIRRGRFGLRNIQTFGGLHIHHLVPGILLLLLSGYLGIGLGGRVSIPFTALLFGIGAALTLDEFALWLHLEDVYWAKQGRDSIDAVIIMATLLAIGVLGHPFFTVAGEAFGRMLGIG